MRHFFLVIYFFMTSVFAETNIESVESHLRFYKKENSNLALNYTFIKKLPNVENKNALFTLKLTENNKLLKEKVINSVDASILIAQMNDLLWDFEYKKKVTKGDCSLFSELEIGGFKTIICHKEKIKAAKILGVRSRLDYLLKTIN